MSQDKSIVFISHSVADSALAKFFGDKLEKDFLNVIKSFVSSRPQDNRPGLVWYNSITSKLLESNLILVLANKASIGKPWINFEAGAGLGLSVPVIPLCCGGLLPGQIEGPLSNHQALLATKSEDLKVAYSEIAAVSGMDTPAIDFVGFAAAIASYGNLDIDEQRVRELLNMLDIHIPGATKKTAANVTGKKIILDSVSAVMFDEASIVLRELRNLGMLDFDWILTTFVMTGGNAEEMEAYLQTAPLRSSRDGLFYHIRIEANSTLIEIAKTL